jgi:hypothetical protein
MNLNVNKVFTITQKCLPLLRNAQKKDGVARVINVCAYLVRSERMY